MLLISTFLMGFWLMLVGGLQGGFGQWGEVDGARTYLALYFTRDPSFLFDMNRCMGYHWTRQYYQGHHRLLILLRLLLRYHHGSRLLDLSRRNLPHACPR